MLLGENGGGHQNGHLLVVHDGLHDGPQGNLGLAEAHVAAEEPVHGDGGLHIRLDVRDAAELIVGLGVGEILLEFRLPGGIGGEGVALLPLPGGVELDELGGHILGGFSGLGLGLLPGLAAHFVELDGGILAAVADILGNQIKLGGGDEEHIGARVGDLDIILDRTVDLHLLHADEAADAVVVVDHQIAGDQVGEGVELLAVGGTALFGLALDLAPA